MIDEPDGAPSRRPLSLDRIVSATLELIDEQGIGVTSMRTVGDRLNVRAMSLYRYVDNREDLFDAVVDRVVNELDDDPEVAAHVDDEWRPYLTSLARGVRRYARAHPHAFPLVATRPANAPWINPPLRSLRWIEAMLATLRRDGFDDDQVVFAYRTFNSYLLGFLLLETSALALRDPRPGDGSFQTGGTDEGTDPVDPADPVPGGLSPTRSADDREAVDSAQADDLLDPLGDVDLRRYPTISDLRAGLSSAFYEAEFASGLANVLDRIGAHLAGATPGGGESAG